MARDVNAYFANDHVEQVITRMSVIVALPEFFLVAKRTKKAYKDLLENYGKTKSYTILIFLIEKFPFNQVSLFFPRKTSASIAVSQRPCTVSRCVITPIISRKL